RQPIRNVFGSPGLHDAAPLPAWHQDCCPHIRRRAPTRVEQRSQQCPPITPPRTVASSCARSASTSEATARAAAGPDSSAGPTGPAQPGTGTEMSRAGPMRCTEPVLHGTFFAPAPVAGRSRALPPRGWARSADDARCVGDLEAVRLAGAGVGERALVGVQAL